MKKHSLFGKYLLLDRINVGGMAEVFIAKASREDAFSGFLAIKRILPTMAEDDEFISMFIDEARICAQLNHPNIVHIHELGKHEGAYFIAMEYVAGRDLRSLLDRLKKLNAHLPIRLAVEIIAKVCEGLEYAHSKTDVRGMRLNIIHRDVSPQNVLVSFDGVVKVIDFGIAKAAIRSQRTQAGILKGKFGYMSPEQVQGLPIDHRTDLFAAGVLLFELLTRQKLFVGSSDYATLEKVRNAEVPSLLGLNPDVSEELERIVLKSLARVPDERYQSAAEFQLELIQYLEKEHGAIASEGLSEFVRGVFFDDIEKEESKLKAYGELNAQVISEQAVSENESLASQELQSREVLLENDALTRSDSISSLQERKKEPGGEGDSVAVAPNLAGNLTVFAKPNPPELPRAIDGLNETGETRSIGSIEETRASEKIQETRVLATHKPEVAPTLTRQQLKRKNGFRVFAAILGATALVGTVAFFQRRLASDVVVTFTISPSHAELSVDGQVAQPGAPTHLTPGPHVAIARARDYNEMRRDIVLKPGVNETIEMLLSPVAPATANTNSSPVRYDVSIRAVPQDAEIRVDGAWVDSTPNAPPVTMEPGKSYLITARLKGYAPFELRYSPEGPNQAIDLKLPPLVPDAPVRQPQASVRTVRKATGKLICGTKPAGADVWVDGRPSGRRTPISQSHPLLLSVGSHKIVFKLRGKVSGPHPIDIREEATAKLLNVSLD